MSKECLKCKYCKLLYDTDDEKEIEIQRQKQIRKNLELFYKTAKDYARKNTGKKLKEYTRNR